MTGSRKTKVRFPAWAADRRPDRFTLLLLVAAAVLGAGLVLLRQASYGPRMWWDAVNYITAARNLLAGHGLVDLHGPLVGWPPLYPAMLAGGGLFGFDPYAVAGPLNAVLFGLTVLVAGWWLRHHLHSRFLWLWGCVSIALALPLAEIASEAMSEAAFILFVTLALTQIDAHLGGGKRASLIRAAMFSALACLTRYLGAAVILAVVPLLLAARVAPREKLKRIAVYTLIAAAPVGLWMLRNYLLVGLPVGPRGKVFYSLPFIVDEAVRLAVGDWWLVGLTAPVLLALVMAARHTFHRLSQRKRDAPVASDVAWGPAARIRRFCARVPDAAGRRGDVGSHLACIGVETRHSGVCSAPVRGAAADGRRPPVCAEAFRAGGKDTCRRPDVGAVPAGGLAGCAA